MAIESAGFDPITNEELFIDTEADSPIALTLSEILSKQDKLAPLQNLAGEDFELIKDPSRKEKLRALTAPQQIKIADDELPTISRQQAQLRGDVAAGLTTGLQLTAQPAGVPSPLAPESLVQIGAAAALGLAVGGVPGGLTALAVGGLNAFLNARAEKRKRKLAAQTVQIAKKAEKERLAREDRFATRNRLDALEAQRFSRRQIALQSQWKGMQTLNQLMVNLVNTNQTLKERFATRGF